MRRVPMKGTPTDDAMRRDVIRIARRNFMMKSLLSVIRTIPYTIHFGEANHRGFPLLRRVHFSKQ